MKTGAIVFVATALLFPALISADMDGNGVWVKESTAKIAAGPPPGVEVKQLSNGQLAAVRACATCQSKVFVMTFGCIKASQLNWTTEGNPVVNGLVLEGGRWLPMDRHYTWLEDDAHHCPPIKPTITSQTPPGVRRLSNGELIRLLPDGTVALYGCVWPTAWTTDGRPVAYGQVMKRYEITTLRADDPTLKERQKTIHCPRPLEPGQTSQDVLGEEAMIKVPACSWPIPGSATTGTVARGAEKIGGKGKGAAGKQTRKHLARSDARAATLGHQGENFQGPR